MEREIKNLKNEFDKNTQYIVLLLEKNAKIVEKLEFKTKHLNNLNKTLNTKLKEKGDKS